MWCNRNFHSFTVGMQNGIVSLEDYLDISYKIKILLTYDSQILILGIFPKELKTYLHTKAGIQMSTAALFIVAKTWKQPRCSSADERVNKLWYLQKVAYHSALKINELTNHEKTQRKLKY